MKKKLVFFSVVAVFSVLVFRSVGKVSADNSPCQLPQTSLPAGFGSPLSFLSSGLSVFDVFCDSSSVKVRTNDLSPTLYTWKTGYLWENDSWQPYEFDCPNKQKGSWCLGPAEMNIPQKTNISREQFVIAYTCQKDGSTWKCGCRDSVCRESFWQLRVFGEKRAVESTSGRNRAVSDGENVDVGEAYQDFVRDKSVGADTEAEVGGAVEIVENAEATGTTDMVGTGKSGDDHLTLDNRVRTCVFGGEIKLERVFENIGLHQPLAAVQAPGTDRWYVAQRNGIVRTFVGNGRDDKIFLDLRDKVRAPSPIWSEEGLLGIAFHPQKNRFFVNYINHDRQTVVSYFDVNDDKTAVVGSEKIVLRIRQPNANHNGGGIAFGPDGYLYIGLGDGGGAGDDDNNAQNTGNLLGAMLRIDVDRGDPYAIPPDNPFAGESCDGGKCPEIWAWGLRNPWRWSFDRVTGLLWAGDVGQDDREEIDIIRGGKNYGWRCYEGHRPFRTDGCGPKAQYESPVIDYPTPSDCSVTGGYVYRGSDIVGLRGIYVFGDYCSGRMWQLPITGGEKKLLLSTGLAISSFAEDNRGELYVIDYDGGGIYKIVAASGDDRAECSD